MGTYGYVIGQLNSFGLAYLHVIEGVTQGSRDIPAGFDMPALRRAFKGRYMANNGYDLPLALDARRHHCADLIAFGRLYIATRLASTRSRNWKSPPMTDGSRPLRHAASIRKVRRGCPCCTLSAAIDIIPRCFPIPREPVKLIARTTGPCCTSTDPTGMANVR